MTPRDSALRTALDGRWADVRADVRDQLGRYRPVEPGLSTERYRARVLDLLGELAATKRPHAGFAPEYGGEGDVGGAVVSFQTLGYGDLSLLVKAGVQWGLFGGAVQLLGTARHHDEYLRAIMDGDLLGCFAMTETGHGSDVAHLRTTATYDPATQEFVVDTPEPGARKDYIGNAARDGRMAVVFAQLVTGGDTHGVHAFLVPIRDDDGATVPGVTITDCGDKGGLNGVDNGRLTFDHVRVPREALLDRFADVAPDGTYRSSIENESRRFFTMLGTLVRGRISVAGGAGSAAEKALALAVHYAAVRRQFADPATGEEVVLLDYRAHQRKLLPALATSYALHFAQEELVGLLHGQQAAGAAPDEAAQRELENRAAGLKAVGTWHATATIQTCREACGGAGYLSENLLVALKADSDVFTTFEGDNTVLLQLLAKGLLADYGRRVGALGAVATARFAAGVAAAAVTERVRPPRRFDPYSRAAQRALLHERAEHLLTSLARRLRVVLRPGADQFAIFNEAQDHLLHAARAHVDAFVFDAFERAIAQVIDPAARELLGSVCDLYALGVVEADRAWLLEHGRLGVGGGRAVTAAVNDLGARLRPHAVTLVDAFGIPAAWLDCPMLRT